MSAKKEPAPSPQGRPIPQISTTTARDILAQHNGHDRHEPLDAEDRLDARSDRMVDAAVAAAHHLRAQNLPPIFDLPTLRALWRCGHHRLVDGLRGGGR